MQGAAGADVELGVCCQGVSRSRIPRRSSDRRGGVGGDRSKTVTSDRIGNHFQITCAASTVIRVLRGWRRVQAQLSAWSARVECRSVHAKPPFQLRRLASSRRGANLAVPALGRQTMRRFRDTWQAISIDAMETRTWLSPDVHASQILTFADVRSWPKAASPLAVQK